ncbi:MAG: hypothetical protein U0166_23875 [Acidobacteriota bacterium]
MTGAQLLSDGPEELVAATGPGVTNGQIRAFDYDNGVITAIGAFNLIGSPYSVWMSGAEVDGDPFDEFLVSPGGGPGAGSVRGYNFDGTAVTAIAGLDFVPFTTTYGCYVSAGDMGTVFSEEIVCGAGPDPAAPSSVKTFTWSGSSVALMAGGSFTAFPVGAGATVGTGDFGF